MIFMNQKLPLEFLYISTAQGAYICNNKKLDYLSDYLQLRYQDISSIYVDNKNKIWIGTQDFGLYLLNNNGQKFQSLYQYTKNPYSKSSISDNNINYIYSDKSGCLWLGTVKGVSKFDKYKQGFTTVTISNNAQKGLIDYTVWSFNEDSLNNLYVGTKKDLTIYNPKKNIYSHIFRDGFNQHYLLSIYVENPNVIWCGYDDGLFLLTIKDSKHYHFEKIEMTDENLSKNNRVYQIVEADSNRLWIGSTAGLSIINKKDYTYQFYKHNENEKSIGDGAVKNNLSGFIRKKYGWSHLIKDSIILLKHPTIPFTLSTMQ